MELPQLLYLAVSAVNLAVGMAAGALAWHARRAVAQANIAAAAAQVPALGRRLDETEKELALHRSRLREAEQKIAAAPTERMFADLHTLLERLEGKINVVSERTTAAIKSSDAAQEACNRIEGFFVEKGIGR